MERQSNHVLVGAITLGLVILLLGFVLWLSRYSGEERREYDIFFRQSVSGLAVGSAVTFSGVPVGQVRTIALVPERPEFIRVRIDVQQDVPVLEGTTASLQGVGFTGVTQIQLAGSMAGQQPLERPGPFGVPVIPAAAGGLSQLLESAPQTLERVNVLLARLNEVLDDPNREALAGILVSLDTTIAAVAQETPALRQTIRETARTLEATTRAADQIALTGATADALLTAEGKPLVGDLRRAIATAEGTLRRLDALAATAEPGVRSLTSETIPEVNRLVRDLQEVTTSLGALSAKLDEDPLGAVTGGRPLPDYVPQKADQ